jgi:hypothetical protein
MAKKFKDLANACWKGYKAVGLKDKNGKKVPNCIPESAPVAPAPHIHRVAVTVSDPDSSAVSKREDTVQKMIRISHHTDNKQEAVERAKKHYKKFGWKVHGAEHVGMVHEETQIQEADEIQSSDYKLSASGKKVRAKHIIFHNQDDDKKDDKEDMKEETLVEATVETKKYSWGTMKTVHHGADFSIPLHPEHHQAIAKLKDEQEHHFKDETGRHWTARRKGDEVHFQGANGGNSTKVKHETMKESYDDNRRGFGKRPREDDEYHVPDPEVKKNKLKKEEKMTDDEMAERERIVKGMKKNIQSFKDKYGERAKEVMYATATKLAKEEVDEEVIYYGGDPFEQPSAATIARRERAAEKRKQKEAEQKRQKQLNKEEVEKISEAAPFKTKEDAVKYAKEKVKTHRDNLDGIEVYAHSGGFDVNHTSNSSGRNSLHKVGAKHLGTIYKEEVQLDEANHREFASQGKMHPDMAKHMTVGSHMDYYEPKTGDKVHGKVIKNDGKEVHVKQSHDSYDSKKVGSMHKFKVSSTLEEGRMKDIATNAQETDRLKKKDAVPFDGPYTKTKPAKNSDGTTQSPMSRARELAKQAMKKQMKEEFGVDIDDETADGLVEAAQKVDVPAYLRKQKGEAPLTLKDLKRKDTISDKENLAKLRNEALKGNQHKLDKNKNGKLDSDDFEKLRKEQFENGEVETCMKSYKDFVQSLNEYKSQDGVYRHQGTYGGSHKEPEDDDEDDKPKAKPQGEKRGRGRPKGAASGARQKGTVAKRKTDGADYTGYKLHLPNNNK